MPTQYCTCTPLHHNSVFYSYGGDAQAVNAGAASARTQGATSRRHALPRRVLQDHQSIPATKVCLAKSAILPGGPTDGVGVAERIFLSNARNRFCHVDVVNDFYV